MAAAGDALPGGAQSMCAAFVDSVHQTIDATPVTGSPSDGIPFIATHSGVFHCDDALAVGMLKLLPDFYTAPVVRSRVQDHIEAAHAVVDVGGVYDAAALRFDHHQPSFDAAYTPDSPILMSSAGLVFKTFGPAIVTAIVTQHGALASPTAHDLELIVDRAYSRLIAEVDAIDNGIAQFKRQADEPQYCIRSHLSARVKRLNLPWHTPHSDAAAADAFRRAVKLAVTELIDVVQDLAFGWLPARRLVREAAECPPLMDLDAHILMLTRYCPWKRHLFDLEEDGGIPAGRIKFVVFPDTQASSCTWRVQAVPLAKGTFNSRDLLPLTWRGLSGEALDGASGIVGCIFVHRSGFIGGNKTRLGAAAMARAALTLSAESAKAQARSPW